MKRIFLSLLACLVGAGSSRAAESDVYINNSTATNPQIDAGTVVNNASFQTITTIPYGTQNTHLFTNNGAMSGYPGYRFDFAPTTGQRKPADRFVNTLVGSIDALDTGGFIGRVAGGGAFIANTFVQPASTIRINAKEIQNRGSMSVGPSGLIRLQGETITLTNSLLSVNPLGSASAGFFGGFFSTCDDGSGSGFLSNTNFFPDVGLYDAYWGMGLTTNFNVGNFLPSVNPTLVQTAPHDVTNRAGGKGFTTQIALSDAASWALVNKLSATNAVVQAVFVQGADTNIVFDVRWTQTVFPNGQAANNYMTAIVEFGARLTNALTLDLETNKLYLIDQLASGTNFISLPNVVAGTERPAPFVLSRTTPCDYLFGVTSNQVASPGLFYSGSFSNRVVTNLYAGYSADVESLASRLPAIPNISITNLPGRVEIAGNNVDLSRARIRGEGLVSIKATNLVGTTDTVVDSQNLTFNLAAANGNLRVENLAKDTVNRLSGNIRAWSGSWTNTIPNPDPSLTNGFDIAYEVLVLDARFLVSTQRVLVADFETHSPVVTIKDNMSISNQFLVDAKNLTIDGTVNLLASSWASTNLPNVETLEIGANGSVTTDSLANFGGDTARPYKSMINRGTISAYNHIIRADYFENHGTIISGQLFSQVFSNGFVNISTNFFFPTRGPIQFDATVARLEGGSFVTGGDINLSGNVVKMNNYSITSGGTLRLTVANTLQDSGFGANNVLTTSNGFTMTRAIPLGNLIGTRIISAAAKFAVVEHAWAAPNVGLTKEAFATNMAVGNLVLKGSLNSIFVFRGTTAHNALYVDLLQLDGPLGASLKSLTNSLVLQDNIDIYYSDIKAADSAITAEKLDGLKLGGGRLRWARDFAGPNTSIDVALRDGRSIKVNRALRQSLSIDSDADGIANGLDNYPFDPIRIRSASLSVSKPFSVVIKFDAAPGTVYSVQYSDTVGPANWQNLTTVQNTGSKVAEISVSDPTPAGKVSRVYRVGYYP